MDQVIKNQVTRVHLEFGSDHPQVLGGCMRQWRGKSTLGEINCHSLRQLRAAAPTTTALVAVTYVARGAMQRVNADPIPAWCSSDGSVRAGTVADGCCIRDLAVSGHAWCRT